MTGEVFFNPKLRQLAINVGMGFFASSGSEPKMTEVKGEGIQLDVYGPDGKCIFSVWYKDEIVLRMFVQDPAVKETQA